MPPPMVDSPSPLPPKQKRATVKMKVLGFKESAAPPPPSLSLPSLSLPSPSPPPMRLIIHLRKAKLSYVCAAKIKRNRGGYIASSKNNPSYEGLGLYDIASPGSVHHFCSQLEASPSLRETIVKLFLFFRALSTQWNFKCVEVEKQSAHFFGVTISDEQAESGIVVRVTSAVQSKFKLLYFEQDVNGGYGLALQEDSEKAGKATSTGMYFLHFQVYRMDSTVNALAMAKDLEDAFFKIPEGLQPCEVSELKAGTHIFAVYGDNFFKPALRSHFENRTYSQKDIDEVRVEWANFLLLHI